eukprot:jgi/Ulvmu1/12862/UM098_0047.1
MFSTRFLRGGLKTSVVHVYCSDSQGSRDFRFHWLENEDSEDIAQRFEAQLNQELAEWGRESPGSGDVPAAAVLPAPIPANARVPVTTSLHIEKTSNDSADHEVVLHIVGILRAHELQELLFKEQCKYLERSTGAHQLEKLTVLDVTSCGLTEVPEPISALHSLKTLVLSKNKLTSLPHFIGTLQQLVILNVDDNALTSLPDSLKSLTSLHTLSLSSNALAAPIIDLSALQHLAVLHLGGNPLTYVPELSQASALHVVSLASLHISADASFSAWTVQVLKPPPRVSMRSRSTPVDAALKLLLSRSSLQHPLIAGGLAEMARDTEHRTAMLRAERLLPQLVHAMLAEHSVVAVQSCEALARLAQEPGVAATLAAAATLTSAHELMAAPMPRLQVAGLKVLAAMAVASEAVAEQALTPALIQELLAIAQGTCAEARCAALMALSSLAFPLGNKETLLQSAALVDAVESMAAADSGASHQVRAAAVRVLAVLGQNDKVDRAVGKRPLRGRGLRVLVLDGGGMKGMAEVTLLRELERRTGASIRDLFDVIGGTSTGCMIAMGVGVMRFTLDDMEEVYMDLGSRVFDSGGAAASASAVDKSPADDPVSPRGVKQTAVSGQSWSEMLTRMYRSGEQGVRVAMWGAKHNTSLFEELLEARTDPRTLGCAGDLTLDAAWLGGPRVFGCATHASVSPARPYVFRTYEFPPDSDAQRRAERLALHEGTSRHRIWQAIRASSAAPYYLDDFAIGDLRFCDGAVTVNNPAVIAVQEARMLYPDTPIDCVLSLGVGRAPPAPRPRAMHSYLDVGTAVIESACSVDRVHEALASMLDMSGCVYERMCPEDQRCEVALDCTDRKTIQSLVDAATQYIQENGDQFERICEVLCSKGQGEEPDSPASVEDGLAARPHCVILSAPVTGPAGPGCHVGRLLHALQHLPDTTTVPLASWQPVDGCQSPCNPSQHGHADVGTAQDKAAFGSVVLPAATEPPALPAMRGGPTVGAPPRHGVTPTPPNTASKPPTITPPPPLPRLQTGHSAAASTPPQQNPVLARTQISTPSPATAVHGTPPKTSKAQPPMQDGMSTPHVQQRTDAPRVDESGAGGPYNIRAAPHSPSSPTALPAAPDLTRVLSTAGSLPVERDNSESAPEILEMRHTGKAADAQQAQQPQRQESDGEGSSLYRMLQLVENMMAWSPTSTERADSAQQPGNGSGAAHKRTDVAQAAVGAPAGGGTGGVKPSDDLAQHEVADAVESLLVEERSTLADALPAEPDLAAAPRSSFECSDSRLLLPGSAHPARGLPFWQEQGSGGVGEQLSPVCEAPVGFVIVGAHPLADGVVASYRQRFHAVVDPSDEGTVLRLRLQGTSRSASCGGALGDAEASAAGTLGDSALGSMLRGGRLVRERGGSGAWWRCMCKTTQEFPAAEGGVGATVESLTLQEVVPERVLRGEVLRAALAPVDGGVAVLAAEGCEALVPEAFAAGAAAVLVFRGEQSGGDAAATAAALEHAVRLMRGGRRLEAAMRESGCHQYFALVVAPSKGPADVPA